MNKIAVFLLIASCCLGANEASTGESPSTEKATRAWQWNNLTGRIGRDSSTETTIFDVNDLDGDGDVEIIVSSWVTFRNRVFIIDDYQKGVRCSVYAGGAFDDWHLANVDSSPEKEILISRYDSVSIYSTETCEETQRIQVENLNLGSPRNLFLGDVDADGEVDVIQDYGNFNAPGPIATSPLSDLEAVSISASAITVQRTGEFDNIAGTDLLVYTDDGRGVLNGSSLLPTSSVEVDFRFREFVQFNDTPAKEWLLLEDGGHRILDFFSGEQVGELTLPFFPVFKRMNAIGDRVDEFLVSESSSNANLILYDRDGVELSRTPMREDWAEGIAADTDGDGRVEIYGTFWTGFDDLMMYHEADSGLPMKVIAPRYERPFSILPLDDYNGDGSKENLLTFFNSTSRDSSNSSGGLLAISDETGLPAWEYRLNAGVIIGRPAAGDLDGDGIPELCFGFDHSRDHFLRCQGFSSGFREFTIPIEERLVGVWIADLDGDGANEVVATEEGLTAYDVVTRQKIWNINRFVSTLRTDRVVFFGDYLFLTDGGLWKYRAATGELLFESTSLPLLLLASRDELFYFASGQVGLFDAENNTMGEVLFSPGFASDLRVSLNGQFFMADLCSAGGPITVFDRQGTAIYTTDCQGREHRLIESDGRMILSTEFGAWKFTADALDLLFSSSFEAIDP